MGTSNHLIGLLNFLTFLLSIPILGGGIWLSSRANNTDCLTFLQWPLIVIGISIMVVSLAGFAGACYRNTVLMRLYLVVMFLVIAALIGFIIFAHAVTDKGSGRGVMGRAYLDYYLEDYSGWLEERVASDSYWGKISSCVRDSKVCRKMVRTVGGMPETADMFFLRRLTPLQVAASLRQCVGTCTRERRCGKQGRWREPTQTAAGGAMIRVSCATSVTLARPGFWPASRRAGGRSPSSTLLS
ncbi:tetraspanin-3-like isoform X2 [Prosopis cineraria]|uniref:tetraspanin-3-like isoform X2 n=1 Tax=Prosopis cineraria TaxID=364024 RepID=UPI00240F39D4|nr:tetraspanin-3-like isoform X2 [Prosopis cineraria]